MANFYDPPTAKIDAKQVGTTYHVGLGTTTPGQTSNDRVYGYMLAPDPKFGGLEQVTDLQAKGKLSSYSSELLIDRDFVNYPRVTDGDFSGGMMQQNFLDTTRYWDSDLEIRVPGQLTLRAAWQRRLIKNTVTNPYEIVQWRSDFYLTFREAGFTYYRSDGTSFNDGIVATFLDTDGNSLYIADGVNTIKARDTFNVVTVVTAASGVIRQMWVINQGTSGRFLYFTTTGTDLKKQDLSVAWAPVTVPTATLPLSILDVVPYLSGVAILTADASSTVYGLGHVNQQGFDVWYHDGAVMSRLVRVNQYVPGGMCLCLGDLYIIGTSVSGYEAPVLFKIGGGQVSVVAQLGPSYPANPVNGGFAGLVSGGQYVYFALRFPQVTGITSQDYISVYDTVRGSLSHLGSLDSTDTTASLPSLRQLAVSGRALAWPMVIGGNGYLQTQVNSVYIAQIGTVRVAASGWVASSRLDFNTPGISKMFRRVLVNHAPLATGEQIRVNGYVDLNPVNFTTGLTATATVTNNTVGSTVTILTFPSNTQGYAMYYALKLTAGTGQLTSPTVYYVATEVTTPWDFQFTVDCTSKRQTLGQQSDPQGLTGRDLYYLLKNAWENGQSITLYHPTGETYICAIEAAKFFSPSPQYGTATSQHQSDFESWATLTLRHTNAA